MLIVRRMLELYFFDQSDIDSKQDESVDMGKVNPPKLKEDDEAVPSPNKEMNRKQVRDMKRQEKLA